MSSNLIKCGLIGDGLAGKTYLIKSFINNIFPNDYIPTVFDEYETKVTLNDKTYTIILIDSSGDEGYEKFRPTAVYSKVDVLIICFNVANLDSYEHVKYKWIPEIKDNWSKTPILLVGTQIDRRQNSQKKPITKNEGEKLCKEIKAVEYVECSALTQDGLKEVFEKAIIATLKSPEQVNKRKSETKFYL